jgi:hypothetical protein
VRLPLNLRLDPNGSVGKLVTTLQDLLSRAFGQINRNTDKLAGWISVKDYGATGDGATSDQSAVAAAVAAAYAAGDWLYWPDGTYLTTASIPNLHDVRHFGPGVIKRGSDLFTLAPADADTNRLYVSASGSASNDGLTSSQPLTFARALAVLPNYGPVLEGTWIVTLAAGTYTGGLSLVGLRSRNRIRFVGPVVGHPNVPTAIIDGTSSASENGLYLQQYVYAYVEDIKFANWTTTADSSGLVADQHCNLYTKNVHTASNSWAGINLNICSHAYIEGGIHDGNRHNIRVYSQCSASIGYQATAGANRPIIQNATETGVQIRDSSRGHVDNCDFTSNAVALWGEKVSRVVANGCVFTTNTVAVRTNLGCAYGESTANTFTANGKDYVLYSSHDDTTNTEVYWDRATSRWLFGASAYATPDVKFQWVGNGSRSGSSYNSNCKAAFDFTAAIGYVGLSGGTTSTIGFIWSTVAKASQGTLTYVFSDDSMRFGVNGGATGYRMNGSKFGPDQDNAKTSGDAAFRWSNVYATNLRPGAGTATWTSGAGTPEGAVTAAIGSLFTRTDGGAATTLYVKESGAGNTGWIAK